MNYQEKKIFLGAPVRNRGWILEEYIEAIENQNLKISMFFIVNDSKDNSLEIISKKKIPHRIHNFEFEGYIRGEYSIDHLAYLRNEILDEFLKSDCEYFLSIDTDIIIPEHSISQLIKHEEDIVSMLIRNNDKTICHNFFINGQQIEKEVINGLIPVDMTGAVYLISRRVIESGVRYNYDRLGEDIPFCQSAKEKGFEIYCDTSLKPIHYFKKNLPLIANTYDIDKEYIMDSDKKKHITEILYKSNENIDSAINYFKKADLKYGLDAIQQTIKNLLEVKKYLLDIKNDFYFNQFEDIYSRIIKKINLVVDSLEKNNFSYANYYLNEHLRKDIDYSILLFNNFYLKRKEE